MKDLKAIGNADLMGEDERLARERRVGLVVEDHLKSQG